MRGDLTVVRIGKGAAPRREKQRRGAAARQGPAVKTHAVGRRLGHYESLLLDHGDAEVIETLEALLRAVAARLARRPRARSGRRKR
ncbi:MAG: hypothetical protein ACLQJR_17560 [Stellaceae bacterium]